MKPVKVGIIGCGMICDFYIEGSRAYFPQIEFVACADLSLERAQAKAAQFNIAKACSVEALLGDPTIEMVLNLTIPGAHFSVCQAALSAGKHVYVEKPLSMTAAEGRALLQLAQQKGCLLGGAPDTFLGGLVQTARQLIDHGAIGRPLAATAFFMGSGPESWHPSPRFLYQKGAGPLFDMGPYYLTALVALLGPIRRVSAMTAQPFAKRTITSAPLYGQTIDVEVPTHVTGILELAQGAVATLITSFDIVGSQLPQFEIYGSDGCLRLSDPNAFDGEIQLLKSGESTWKSLALTHRPLARGVGLADLAEAVTQQRTPRASGALAYHVLDTMQNLLDAAQTGQTIGLTSGCEQPAAMPSLDSGH